MDETERFDGKVRGGPVAVGAGREADYEGVGVTGGVGTRNFTARPREQAALLMPGYLETATGCRLTDLGPVT